MSSVNLCRWKSSMLDEDESEFSEERGGRRQRSGWRGTKASAHRNQRGWKKLDPFLKRQGKVNDDDLYTVPFTSTNSREDEKGAMIPPIEEKSTSSSIGGATDISALRATYLKSTKNSPERQGKVKEDDWKRKQLRFMARDEGAMAPKEEKKKTPSIADMTDISALRAAFLKSVQDNKEEPRHSSFSSSRRPRYHDEDPYIREGTAKDFRKRVKQRMRQKAASKAKEIRYKKRQKQPRFVDTNKKPSFFQTFVSTRPKAPQQRPAQQKSNKVTLPVEPISIAELSGLFRIKIDVLMDSLKSLGEVPGDESLGVDVDTMELLAMDLGLEPVRSNRRKALSVEEEDKELLMQRRALDDDGLVARPPVVCIMGHVDHGKTTLMDALRKRSKGLSVDTGKTKKKKSKRRKSDQSKDDITVAGTEAGGITQVISAFQVALKGQDKAVTFLDTPGHAAFRSMRESGSNAADVIVLVIAADDGVSKQTIEIINFYKSIVSEAGGEGISLMVAMTKIDKPGIELKESTVRIENQLLEHEIIPESLSGSMESKYGNPVQIVPVSGLTGEGLDDLIEGLVLQSQVMDLHADPDARVEGIILDSRVDRGLGVVVDCIVRWGSLERGDIVVSGTHMGKVKALKNVNGAIVKEALPSQPIQIIGFRTCPKAGDPLICVESEEKAAQLTERRNAVQPSENSAGTRSEAVDDDRDIHISGVVAQLPLRVERFNEKHDIETEVEGDVIRIPVVVKADADGTLAALREALIAVGDESEHDILVDPIISSIGPITENEVKSAAQSKAVIFSFNVEHTGRDVAGLLDELEVPHRSHKVIYSLLDEAKTIFADYLPIAKVVHMHGQALVQEVFSINNKRDAEHIAGLRVLEGRILKEKGSVDGKEMPCFFRVVRGDEIVSPQALNASSLRKVKEIVDEVRRGEECGLGLEDYEDFEKGDIIECYSVEERQIFV